ncbi:fungal-specific transcription factor domain-containing protein [Truncatella angustata]|uniref:Fungal-specific transcription factor domain-containing protein n=1 Tax=Truncatella angustata TaxID=152316 RepID=A0A9P8UV53_9PEZI|nr:fungal-specific transcription factor domain-containing protein [Truncatella angustata]KAH6659081.1 fungal-specific transcription factor domain-containing protein [Truncatella angustata]
MRYRHMVRPRVKRSKGGCLTCRGCRTKCDEAKPTCSRCKRLQVKCVGNKYAYNAEEVACEAEKQRQLVRSQIDSSLVARPLLPSAKTVYLHHFVTVCSKAILFADDQTHNPFSREIYCHFSGCEHLQLAVNALAAGDLQRRQPGHNERYYEFYGQAVNKLNAAISNPKDTASVATLISVLLLAFCEISSSNSSAWLSHIKGARDLLLLRGGPSKNPVLARLFSIIDVGSSFFLGQKTLLPLDYIDDNLVMNVSNTPGEYWPCWDTTGTSTARFNQRLRIVASLSSLQLSVKRSTNLASREAAMAEARGVLEDIIDHWSAPVFQRPQLHRLYISSGDQIDIEDSAAKSACILALIDITIPLIEHGCRFNLNEQYLVSPIAVAHHVDTILAASSMLTEQYCLAGLPWPLFMAGVHVFRDDGREMAILQTLKSISSSIFHPCEGAIRLLQVLWERQRADGIKLCWRKVLDELGGSIYIML